MVQDHGTPAADPSYWNAIDPVKFIADISAPVEIQAGTADDAVPPDFSSSLNDRLKAAGKTVKYHEYSGANHNLYPDTNSAMSETVNFFNRYLK